MRVAAAAMILAAVGSARVSAQSDTNQPDWLSQARIVAEMEGVSVGEAVRRARLQAVADRQAARFSQDENFAGSWIERSRGSYRLKFAFKGGSKGQIDDPELASASEITTVRYSLKEMHDERVRLTSVLKAQGVEAGFEIIPQQNRMLLYPSDAAKLNALVSAGTITLRDFVSVQPKTLVRKAEATVEGAGPTIGSYVDPADGYSYGNNCSAAFVVTAGSVRGLSTAGHCTKYAGQTQTHRGLAIGTRRGYQESDGLDAAWFRNDANTYLNRVRVNSTSYYAVSSVASASPPIGSSICLIKRDSTQQCAYVKSTTIYFGTDGPYIAADRDVSIESDSGAPWLYGGVAYGIHSGDAETSVGALSFFTPGASLPKMGISIATN